MHSFLSLIDFFEMGNKATKKKTTDFQNLSEFQNLVSDAWMHIFSFLHPKDLCNLQLLNKDFYQLVDRDDEVVWKMFSNQIQQELQFQRPKKMGWKQFACTYYRFLCPSIADFVQNSENDEAKIARWKTIEKQLPNDPLITPNVYAKPLLTLYKHKEKVCK